MKWLSILAILPTALAFQQHVKPIHQKTSALNFFPEQFSRAEECATHYDSCNIDELEDLANGKSNQATFTNVSVSKFILTPPKVHALISFFNYFNLLPILPKTELETFQSSELQNRDDYKDTQRVLHMLRTQKELKDEMKECKLVTSSLSLLNLIKYIKLNHNLLPLYRCH